MSAAAASKKSYSDLAKEAIASLKDRTGSSAQAIKAYITSNHPSIKFAQHLLRTALNKGAESGKFVKVKASFKLGAAEKKAPKKVVAKKVVAKKAPAAKKAATPKVAKPDGAKKATPTKKGK
jgi:histone H1/5